MAAACALAVTAALLPLDDSGTDAAPAVRTPAVPVTRAGYASAQDGCADPEASLDPLTGPTDGAAVRTIVDRERLVVGVDQNSYLWGFRDPATGRIDGFDIDIVKAVAQDILGDEDKVQYLTVPTNKRIELIENGTVDMVVRTMTINCKRLEDVAFSTAYFEAGQQILAPKSSPITGYDASLKGMRVCTADDSTGDTKLTDIDKATGKSDAQRFGADVQIVPNQLDCLVRVQLGLADAVLTDNALAAGQAAQDPSMELKGRPVTREPYGVAMNLGSPDLVRRVNQVLDGYRAGGSGSAWMKSYDHWLADELKGISGPPEPKYKVTPTQH
ncbi:MAG TPA: glutamate ABC transporter substrate-binding protein [Streptomyces sp.]